MRFYADDLGSVIPVQWYFTRPDALIMPYSTPFTPRLDIRSSRVDNVLGEDTSSIRKHKAGNVRRGPGRVFCGNERQWTRGCSVLDPIRPVNVATGLPCCCGPSPWLGRGGMLSNGQGVPTQFILQDDGSYILQDDGSRMIWT